MILICLRTAPQPEILRGRGQTFVRRAELLTGERRAALGSRLQKGSMRVEGELLPCCPSSKSLKLSMLHVFDPRC